MQYKIKSTWEGIDASRLLKRYPCLESYDFKVVREIRQLSCSKYFGGSVETPYITIYTLEELEELRRETASNLIITVDGEIEIYNAPRER